MTCLTWPCGKHTAQLLLLRCFSTSLRGVRYHYRKQNAYLSVTYFFAFFQNVFSLYSTFRTKHLSRSVFLFVNLQLYHVLSALTNFLSSAIFVQRVYFWASYRGERLYSKWCFIKANVDRLMFYLGRCALHIYGAWRIPCIRKCDSRSSVVYTQPGKKISYYFNIFLALEQCAK